MKNRGTRASSEQEERKKIASLLDTSSHERSPRKGRSEPGMSVAETVEETEDVEDSEVTLGEDYEDSAEAEETEGGEERGEKRTRSRIDLEEFTQSESGRAGLFLTLLALVGIIVLMTVPLFSQEGSDGESYSYNDFGDEVEQDFGKDFDKHYHDSAKLGLYSLFFLLLCGLGLLAHSRTNRLLNVLNAVLGCEGLGNDCTERSAFRLVAAAILLIPASFIALTGSRFEGFVLLSSKGHVGGYSPPDGSPAGVILLVIGVVLIMLIAYFIYLTLPGFMELLSHKKKNYDYLRSCQHFCEIVFLIALVALLTLPLMPVFRITVGNESAGNTYTDEIYLSEGFTGAQTYDEMEEFNKLHKDFGVMKFMLTLMLLVSVLSFSGTLLFPFQIREDLQQVLISLIALALLAALLILFVYLFMLGHGGDLEDALTDSSGVSDSQVKASYNVLPLLGSLAILGISSKYIFEIANTSILPLLRQ